MICSKPAEAETKDLAKVKGEGAAHSMFKEIRLAEQRIVDGKVFPLILTPNVLLESADAAANLFEANSTFLEQKLKEHGAIFLREFPLQSGEDFDCVVKALGWPSVPYIGSAPRTQVVGSVYTANDSNPQAFINFHHEMAQIIDDASWPSRLIFFCEIPPSEGGQTPIIVSHEVTQSLRKQCPQFLQRLDKQGLLYLKVLPKEKDCRYISLEGWPVVFGTNDPREVQER
ncbi:hypothetical protein KP509_1Z062700 [Ceratopteris richardii]|nr:hypothetical protein KP509_1Z062700 [Ceratopteris richardii]